MLPVIVASPLYALVAVVTMRPTPDRDIWWHLRTGEWIVQHRTLPRVDPFYGEAGVRVWRACTWLFDALAYSLHHAMGTAGLAVYALMLGLVTLVALQGLASRASSRPDVVIGLPALALVVLMPFLGPSPILASITLYALELVVLFRALETGRRRGLWWLPVLFALWANVDTGFRYGLLLLALATAAKALERGERPEDRREGLGAILAVTVLCALATLATPYHLGLYASALDRSGQMAGRDIFDDLMSPLFRRPADWIMLALLLAATVAAGRRWRQAALPLLVMAASAFAAFRASHDAWLVAVSAVAVLSMPRAGQYGASRPGASLHACEGADVETAASDAGWTRRSSWKVGTRGRIGLAALTAMAAAAVVWFIAPIDTRWNADVSARFPATAAQVIEDRRYPGPLFTTVGWGSYLLWRLPRLETTVDGRLNLLGDARLRRLIATWDGARDWAADPDLAMAGTIIVPAESSLTTLLHGDPRFVVVYTDRVAALFLTRRAAHRGSAQ